MHHPGTTERCRCASPSRSESLKQCGGHHLEPLGSRATQSAVRWVNFSRHFHGICRRAVSGSTMSRAQNLDGVAATGVESIGAGTMATEKAAWRQRLLATRRGLSLSHRDSQQVIDHVISMAPWQQAVTIAAYLAMPHECDPAALVTLALNHNKRVAMPRINEDGVMAFAAWQPQDPISRFKGRTPQPQASAPSIKTQEIDLFIVPLLGCDAAGYRLGYGGGYYDRVLSTCHGFKLGLCFEEQRVVTLPREEHDVRLDAVVTPGGWVTF